MKKSWITKKIILLISVMLIAAMALTMSGCGTVEETAATSEPTAASAVKAEPEKVGTGATQFTFVVDDGKEEKEFLVSTDKTTVGEALLELELIAGDESDYGLYVKTVNGVTADYDKDKSYWAFYIDGEYAQTGVDSTEIKAGATYTFKVEKG